MWDVFISHASEDKPNVVEPLARLLEGQGLSVWYDKMMLTLGDSLRRKIDEGLAGSRFGVVILSQRFFAKNWPQKELDALVAMESYGRKVILPVWHDIVYEEILRYSPLLADRFSVSTQGGLQNVAAEIIRAVRLQPATPVENDGTQSLSANRGHGEMGITEGRQQPPKPTGEPAKPDAEVSLRGAAATSTEDPLLRQQLLQHPSIQRLMNNANWRDAAAAAVEYQLQGTPSPVAGWEKTRTWDIVRAVYDELVRRG